MSTGNLFSINSSTLLHFDSKTFDTYVDELLEYTVPNSSLKVSSIDSFLIASFNFFNANFASKTNFPLSEL